MIFIKRSDIFRLITAICFTCSFELAYNYFLNPYFEYLNYRLVPRDVVYSIYVYILCVVPSLWQRSKMSAIGAGVSLLYVIVYIPTQISILEMWQSTELMFIMYTTSLFIGQLIIQSFAGLKVHNETTTYPLLFNTPSIKVISLFSILSLIFIVSENYNHMQFVGFEDVYELRSLTSMNTSQIGAYLTMWIVAISIPYFVAVWVKSKRMRWFIYALLISIIIYMITGLKSALLMPIQALVLRFLVNAKHDSTTIISIAASIVVTMLTYFDIDQLIMLRAIVLMRLLSIGGWNFVMYFDYFSQHGFTYWTHVGLISAIFGRNYGAEPELGRLIGDYFIDSSNVNSNANFWVTDGVAASGFFGVIIVSFMFGLILYLFKKFSCGLDQRVVIVFLTGFWMFILNASLFTTMLSGGGLFVLTMLVINYIYSRNMLRSAKHELN